MPLDARRVFAATTAATFLLYQLPYGGYVVYPLLLLSTVVHELGHVVVAALVGADRLSFRLAPDGSGLALHTAVSSTRAGLIAAGGLCGPALVAAILLAVAARRRAARGALAGFGALLALAAALWVRGAFGLGFTAAVAAAALAIAAFTRPRTAQIAAIVLAVQLGLSVYARRGYLFAADQPSDTGSMARAFGGAPWQWGLACAALSIALLALGVAAFWRATRRSRG